MTNSTAQDDLRGSYRLIYSTLGKRDRWLFIPAVALALCAGVVPSLTAQVIGSAFNGFTQFNLDDQNAEQAKRAFMATIVRAIWQLCLLAGGTLALSTAMITTWVVIGERVARGWRLRVYDRMNASSMTWFETQLPINVDGGGSTEEEENEEKESKKSTTNGVGAGGVMAKFARETDDVRIASAQTAGQMIESFATVIASLTIAFRACWSLALIVLSTIPIMMVVVQLLQKRAIKWHMLDMDQMARAGKVLEQSVQAITSVKALTIESRQAHLFMKHIEQTVRAWNKLAFIYGSQFGLMTGSGLLMFAGGFWYGSHLVQVGTYTTGDVFTTFWSCVIVSTTIPTMVQRRSVLEMGKVSAASLTRMVKHEPSSSLKRVGAKMTAGSDTSAALPLTPFSATSNDSMLQKPQSFASRPVTPTTSGTFDSPLRFLFGPESGKPSAPLKPMRRIWPNAACQGEVSIQKLTFSYPSRPDEVVLRDVNLFLPAGEFTFILGASGSGKSTIAHLLLGLYADFSGKIFLDEQDLAFVDPAWTRANVAGINQAPMIFDMSIHDNVALGLCGRSDSTATRKANHVPRVSRKRVQEACRMALLDQDIRRMPDGYNTLLGVGGVDLSGGQKQRLALARAIVRDPTVLILDEATSALDITNRTLVMALIRKWRRGKTTIVITHDFSQIDEGDFVYMLEQGQLVEQGYRMDLERRPNSKFTAARALTGQEKDDHQRAPPDTPPSPTGIEWQAKRALDQQTDNVMQEQQARYHVRASRWGMGVGFGNVYSNADGWTARDTVAETMANADVDSEEMLGRTPLSAIESTDPTISRPGHQRAFSSTSSVHSSSTQTGSVVSVSTNGLRPLRLPHERQVRTMREQGTEASLALSSVAVSQRRPDQPLRKAWSEGELDAYTVDLNDDGNDEEEGKDKDGWIEDDSDNGEKRRKTKNDDKFFALLINALRVLWSTSPRKWLLFLGLLCTLIASGVQPCFSYVLGRLLTTMGTPNRQSDVLPLSLGVMALAIADGVGQMMRFALLQLAANYWIEHVRRIAIANVFSQDKTWFDREENSSAMLLVRLIKDPEDAKSFISRILGEVVIVVSNLMIVFVWSIVNSWQLTLAGLALGPVFYVLISLQSKAILHFEKQNKLQRERVSKRFYAMILHVREIRSMGLHDVFHDNFRDAVRYTEKNGIRAAPFIGLGDGIKDACIYVAQAFLYYIGAVLMTKGLMTLEQMFVVTNLILFGVSFGAGVLSYLPSLSKSVKAVQDMQTILKLDARSASDYVGQASPIVQGALSFRDVTFAYPGRPDKIVLNKCSFDVAPGERVALVGASGCGKSTVAALLQRLYEPLEGSIVVDAQWPLHAIHRHHLRAQLACVAQRTDLFDESIRANLLLAAQPTTTESRMWQALDKACCESFVRQLDDGLDTTVGERANFLSGGQKQRLAIARALIRESARIRILDECTSALDPQNQENVASNLLSSVGATNSSKNDDPWFDPYVTSVIVTHKVELMKRCDRIIVMHAGTVVQEGTYEQLIKQTGKPFSKLANAGEWGA